MCAHAHWLNNQRRKASWEFMVNSPSSSSSGDLVFPPFHFQTKNSLNIQRIIIMKFTWCRPPRLLFVFILFICMDCFLVFIQNQGATETKRRRTLTIHSIHRFWNSEENHHYHHQQLRMLMMMMMKWKHLQPPHFNIDFKAKIKPFTRESLAIDEFVIFTLEKNFWITYSTCNTLKELN